MSDAAQDHQDGPHGTMLLPADLTPQQFRSAPVLASLDALLVEGLTHAEDEAFAAAIET